MRVSPQGSLSRDTKFKGTHFQQLTVVLLTSNPYFLRRQLQLVAPWAERCVILDGFPISQDLAPEFAKLDKRFTYHHEVSFASRLRSALTDLRTEFGILVTDDDIFLPSGVEAALQLLSRQPSVGSVCGPGLCLMQDPYQPGYWGLWDSNLKLPDYYLSGRLGWQLRSIDASSRVKDHAAAYKTRFWWQVQRTSVMKLGLQVIADMLEEIPGVPDPVVEVVYELSCALLAPAESIPELFWLRSGERKPLFKSPAFTGREPLFESPASWLTDSSHSAAAKAVSRILIDRLGDQGRIVYEALWSEYARNSRAANNNGSSNEIIRKIKRFGHASRAALPNRLIPRRLDIYSRRFRNAYNSQKAIECFKLAGGIVNESELAQILKALPRLDFVCSSQSEEFLRTFPA